MKNRLTAITLATILFAAVLMSLSCQDASQNTNNTMANNTAMNANQSNSDQNSDSDSTLGEDCTGKNVEARKRKVFGKIEGNIKGNPFLDKQYSNNRFDFDVVVNNEDLVVYFWGVVLTKKEDKVDDLNRTFKKFVKNGCVSKVVFGEPPNDRATVLRGFEYELCESPNEVCSNGTCGPRGC